MPKDANGVEQWKLVDFTNPDNGSVLYKAQDEEQANTIFFDPNAVSSSFDQQYPNITDVTRWESLAELSNFITNASDQEFIASIANRIDLDSLVDWLVLVDASGDIDTFERKFILGRSASGKFFMAFWDHDASWGQDWEGNIRIMRRLDQP